MAVPIIALLFCNVFLLKAQIFCEEDFAGTDQNLCAQDKVEFAPLLDNFPFIAKLKWSGGAGTFEPSDNQAQGVYHPSVGEYNQSRADLNLEVDYSYIPIDSELISFDIDGTDNAIFTIAAGNLDDTSIFTGGDIVISAMAYDPDLEVVYCFATDNVHQGYYRYNIAAQALEKITALSRKVYACAFDHVSKKLYAISSSAENTTGNQSSSQALFLVNRDNGAMNKLGAVTVETTGGNSIFDTNFIVQGLTWHPTENMLYGISSENLYTFSPNNGATTFIAKSGVFGTIGMAYDYQLDRLYGLTELGILATFNTKTAATAQVGAVGHTPVTALTFLPNTEELIFTCSDQVSIYFDEGIETNTPETLQFCVGDEILIEADGGDTYEWSTGEETESIFVDEVGSYSVTIEKNNCSLLKTIEVRDNDCDLSELVKFPTAFSPNGDDINDYFQAHSLIDVAQYELSIFNRWGKQVFNSRSMDQVWGGHLAQAGNYMFVLRCKLKPDGSWLEYQGNVLLMR